MFENGSDYLSRLPETLFKIKQTFTTSQNCQHIYQGNIVMQVHYLHIYVVAPACQAPNVTLKREKLQKRNILLNIHAQLKTITLARIQCLFLFFICLSCCQPHFRIICLLFGVLTNYCFKFNFNILSKKLKIKKEIRI